MNVQTSIKFLLQHYMFAIVPVLIFLSFLSFRALKDKVWMKSILSNYHKHVYKLLVILIIIICFIVYKDYLLLKNAFLFWDINDDSYVSFYPKLCNTFNYIKTYGLPKWSFKMGMGQNLWAYSFLEDPSALLILLAGKNIASHLIYMDVLEMTLAGVMICKYLKLLNLSDYSSIVGGVLYAFCGYVTAGNPFFIFMFQAVNFSFFLVGFELLYIKNKWYLFAIAVCLASISGLFNMFSYSIFLFAYAFFRHLQSGKLNVATLGRLYIRMFAAGVIGILLSGPFMFQNIVQMLNSPRGSGLISYTNKLISSPVLGLADKLQMGTSLLRFFSNDLLGSGSNFKGWFNYVEAPMFYCGIPCLLLLPQIFFFVSKRHRIIFTLFLSFWMIPVIFPYFRYAFWLFAGDYYRIFALFIVIIFIFYAIHALEYIFKNGKINMTLLIATSAIFILFLCFPVFVKNSIINNKIRLFVIIMIIIYTAILSLVGRVKDIGYLKGLFFIAIFLDICFSANITANTRGAISMQTLNTKASITYCNFSYNDYSLDAVKYIKSRDSSFYRIDRTCDSSDMLNFSQIQGFNGTASYNSFNQVNYVKYLILMGIIDKNNEASSRWIQGLANISTLESENNVKYFLRTKNDRKQLSPIWDSVAMIGDVKIFKNNFLFPFGYTYDSYIRESSFKYINPKQKEQLTMHAFVIGDKDAGKVSAMKEYLLRDTVAGAFDSLTYYDSRKKLSEDTLEIATFNDNYLSGTITVSKDKMMYLSIPYDVGWHLRVDGKEEDKILINGGMTGVLVFKGLHSIEMVYQLPYWNAGLIMSVTGIILFAGLWFYPRLKNSAKKGYKDLDNASGEK
jgi:membrane protein YfhO